MDLESAEWCILESWIKDGTLRRISQLILTIDLQWAGFEVGGVEEEVVRFWYSVLESPPHLRTPTHAFSTWPGTHSAETQTGRLTQLIHTQLDKDKRAAQIDSCRITAKDT